MKFNVEAKGYHESMHHYWRIYRLCRYNGKVPNIVMKRKTKTLVNRAVRKITKSKLFFRLWIFKKLYPFPTLVSNVSKVSHLVFTSKSVWKNAHKQYNYTSGVILFINEKQQQQQQQQQKNIWAVIIKQMEEFKLWSDFSQNCNFSACAQNTSISVIDK